MRKSTESKRIFLDTSVIIGKILNISKEAEKVFNDPSLDLYTNEYAIKELYHVLKKKFSFSESEIGYAIEYVRAVCVVLPMPSKHEIKSIRISDKSDRPIVYSAKKHGLILYIDDEKTYLEAVKYTKVKRIPKD
jgi:predicted nucleic acid-binding protein